MALATRCPHCQAVFRVVVDQLKLRGGLVRCGDCAQVFDAIGTLIYVDDASASAAPAVDEVPELTLTGVPDETTPQPTEDEEPAPPPDLNTLALFEVPVEPATDAEVADARDAAPESALDADANVDPDKAAPAFLNDGSTPPRRHLSLAVLAGVVLAAVVLIAQVLVQFRTDLVARWPSLRPALVGLCAPFQCTVGWPTRADLLAVVGSELLAIPGTTALELNAVVRNRGSIRVALPAIEVALTDTQNRVVVRRVFAPAEYLASAGEGAEAIDAGIAPGADHAIKLVIEARDVRASGFVVYPFYM